MTARQENYAEKAPVSAQGVISRAFLKSGGRSNAIKAKCLSCCNFDREEIRSCTVETCPLWAFRPFQAKASVYKALVAYDAATKSGGGNAD